MMFAPLTSGRTRSPARAGSRVERGWVRDGRSARPGPNSNAPFGGSRTGLGSIRTAQKLTRRAN